MEDFRKRLLEAFAESGLSETALAKMTGLTQASISRYLCGKCIARPKNIEKLADALNVNWVWLAGFNVRKEKKSEQGSDEKNARD